MKICLDLDNTLIALNDFWIKKVSAELGYNYTGYDNVDWTLKWLPDDFVKRSHELFVDPEFMGNLPIIDGSQAKLLKWKCDGHELIVITAREAIISNATYALVRRDFPMVDDLMVVGWGNDKKELLKEFDVLVDDNPLCIKAAIEVGIPKIFMISNNDTRYNLPYHQEFKDIVNIVSSIVEVEL